MRALTIGRRVVTTVEELDACSDFATLHWFDESGLPHAHIAVTMKEHVRLLAKLFPDQPSMWAMTVLHEGDETNTHVIKGGVKSVTAALDALPVGSIITCDEQDEDLVYVKRASGMGFDVWREDGRSNPVNSEHVARHQVPITVVREGNGA